MTHDEYLAMIRAEADALDAVARTAALDTKVPTCPKWTIEDLVDHVGHAHRFGAGNVDQAVDAGPNIDTGSRGDQPVTEWLDEGANAIVEKLSSIGPSKPCWTLNDENVSGFWARRQAHETALHRWDAENAAGTPQPIEAERAADGIDEYLGLVPFFSVYRGDPDPWGTGETIHFHSTDAPGEWLVRLGDNVEITREHAKGDVAARGPASDLLLVVTSRKTPDAVELFGDVSLLDRWQQRAQF